MDLWIHGEGHPLLLCTPDGTRQSPIFARNHVWLDANLTTVNNDKRKTVDINWLTNINDNYRMSLERIY